MIAEEKTSAGNAIEVLVENITVNPYQPRKNFLTEELQDLANSIKQVGLIHPPTVRPLPNKEGVYELVAGERRLRAVQLAGIKKIVVMVREASDYTSAQAALIENIQRVDLNPIEVAKALQELVVQQGLNQDSLAQKVGKKRSTIANYLRLLTLPDSIQQSVQAGLITMGHAKVVLSVEGEEKRLLLHEMILRDQMTVRQAERAALKLVPKKRSQPLLPIGHDEHLQEIAIQLQRALGTKVAVEGSAKKGKVVIDYYNLDDLDRLLELFGVSL